MGDPFVASTDLGGRYQFLEGPLSYDLSVRKDREVAVFRRLAKRSFDPPLDREGEVRGFTSRVAATTEPPPAPGNALAFLVEGPDARAVSGDPGSLVATFRRFDTTITLRAVEYVASGGLASAVRAGKVSLFVHDGGTASAVVPVSPDGAAVANDITFIAVPPAGFALSMVDVVIDFGVRTSARPVAHVAAGVPLHIAIVADARYFAHARATHDGAFSDSGLQRFNPSDKTMALKLPAPVENTAFEAGGELSATTSAGVVEHVLVPSSPAGTSLRIATEERTTMLPDLARLGLTRPTGSYAWSVQHFPTLEHIDDLGGEDARVMTPVSTTKPRTIELR